MESKWSGIGLGLFGCKDPVRHFITSQIGQPAASTLESRFSKSSLFFHLQIKNSIDLKKKLFKHQIKKKFQHSLEWEKNQLAIWDNRSMLHQATPFKGNRIMHRITIL